MTGNAILRTADGGQTWIELKMPPCPSHVDISALWFADEKRGWVAGEIDYGQPAIWETSDGGESWAREQLWPGVNESSGADIWDLLFADAVHGWAVGIDGQKAMIVATSDAGRHWTIQYSGGEITSLFQEVRCEDAENCFVLSMDCVMQTEDGGESWRLRYFDSGLLLDIDVVGHSNVWVAGAWGALLHGTRHGMVWRRVPLTGASNGFLDHVRFKSAYRGWACTPEGQVMMTRDGGKTWAREAIPPGVTPGAMASTSSTLFVIANPGQLLTRPIK